MLYLLLALASQASSEPTRAHPVPAQTAVLDGRIDVGEDVDRVAFSADPPRLITYRGRRAVAWHIEPLLYVDRALDARGLDARDGPVSPDGQLRAVPDGNDVRVELVDAGITARVVTFDEPVRDVAFSADNAMLAVLAGSQVHVVDPYTGRPSAGAQVQGQALSRDGGTLALATGDALLVLSVPALELLRSVPLGAPDCGIHGAGVRVSVAGGHVAYACRGEWRVWEVASGRQVYEQAGVGTVVFVDDERFVTTLGAWPGQSVEVQLREVGRAAPVRVGRPDASWVLVAPTLDDIVVALDGRPALWRADGSFEGLVDRDVKVLVASPDGRSAMYSVGDANDVYRVTLDGTETQVWSGPPLLRAWTVAGVLGAPSEGAVLIDPAHPDRRRTVDLPGLRLPMTTAVGGAYAVRVDHDGAYLVPLEAP